MITIITGRQTDPTQEKILESAVKNYQQNPEHKTFIIIPNHIKFTTEVRAINKLAAEQGKKEASVTNLQVLSFSRLAWYFLKEQEKGLQPVLDDAACSMIIEQILQKENSNLRLLKDEAGNNGLIKQLYQTILMIHSAAFDLDAINIQELDTETANKLADLQIIYHDFLDKIKGRFVTKDEVQLQLNTALAQQKDIGQMDFYFSDFSHFSLQEMLTIKLLFLQAGNVTLAFKTQNGSIQAKQKGDYDFVVQQTIANLLSFIKTKKLPYHLRQLPLANKLSAAEKLNALWSGQAAVSKNKALTNVQAVAADSRYSEAYFAARTIYQQVALKKYRYRDFLILAPNLHEYETYLLPILRKNGIPYFNDLQQEMKYHPLVILIENLAALLENPFNTANMLAIMKTQLLIPDYYQDRAAYRHDVDELENFVLAHGINHTLWQREFNNFTTATVIRLDRMEEEIGKIDKLRSFFVQKIQALLTQLQIEKDPQKAITCFFDFLTQNGIAAQLDKWRQDAEKRRDMQQAQKPEQLWNLLLQLLHDYLLLAEDEFDPRGFFGMLISSFKEANFSQIPATLDAVNLSETGMVQERGYAQVFILGASSNALPQIQKEPSFLTSENITSLKQFDQENAYLEDSQELNNLDQRYQFGSVLALASEQIYISYPILNSANEKLTPSIYYNKLTNMGAPVFRQHELPQQLQDVLSFITCADASKGYLQYLQKNTNVSGIENLLSLVNTKSKRQTASLTQALSFSPEPVNIGSKLAQELYGSNLNASVSQLETFYANSDEYFLTYGLKLRRREQNAFDVIQAGNYFHESFDGLLKSAQKQGLEISKLPQVKLLNLLAQVQRKIRLKARYRQLDNQPFNHYLFKILDQTSQSLAKHWHNNMVQSRMMPQFSELAFGGGQRLAGLHFALGENQSVSLRGKIDRVDLLQNSTSALGQVIDYKSSAKKFDLASFYNGLNLQMVSYLDILARHSKFFTAKDKLALLGGFYQTVTGQLVKLNSKNALSATMKIKDGIADGLTKLEYTGLINNNPDLLLVAEPNLGQEKDRSAIYGGVKKKKNGSFSLPRECNFSDDEIQLLLDYDEYLIKQAAKAILSGKIELNPYRINKQQTALTYSNFKDIFFFDVKMPDSAYHDIDKMSKKELLAKIKVILKGND